MHVENSVVLMQGYQYGPSMRGYGGSFSLLGFGKDSYILRIGGGGGSEEVQFAGMIQNMGGVSMASGVK